MSEDRKPIHRGKAGTECHQVDADRGVGEARLSKVKEVVQKDGNGDRVQRVKVAMCPGAEASPFSLVAGFN